MAATKSSITLGFARNSASDTDNTSALQDGTENARRLADAALRLLHATENAATRGDFELAREYSRKATEAIAQLRAAARARRITKAESQHGRLM